MQPAPVPEAQQLELGDINTTGAVGIDSGIAQSDATEDEAAEMGPPPQVPTCTIGPQTCTSQTLQTSQETKGTDNETATCTTTTTNPAEASIGKSDIENEFLTNIDAIQLHAPNHYHNNNNNEELFLGSPFQTYNIPITNTNTNDISKITIGSANDSIITDIFDDTYVSHNNTIANINTIANASDEVSLQYIEKELEFTETQIKNLQTKKSKLIEIRNSLLVAAIMNTPTQNGNNKNKNKNKNKNSKNIVDNNNNDENDENDENKNQHQKQNVKSQSSAKLPKKQKKYVLTKLTKKPNKDRRVLADRSNFM